MLEQEMADLVEYFPDGARETGRRGGSGWSAMMPVLDARGRRVLGCLRVQSAGVDDVDIVIELEEAPFAG